MEEMGTGVNGTFLFDCVRHVAENQSVMVKVKKDMMGLAGEMRTCAEILKKGHQASITHGNAKATDLLVIGENHQFLRIEVKTSFNGRNFVTGYYPKYTEPSKLHPDIWVFYLPDEQVSTNGDRFFIATHEQVGKFQLEVNKGNKTLSGQGVDNIPLKLLIEKGTENRWEIIDNLVRAGIQS